MKRNLFHLASPPLSPDYNPTEKKVCSGNNVSLLIIPKYRSFEVNSEIIGMVNLSINIDSMDIDAPETVGNIYENKEPVVLVFLDAQGKQYIEELDSIFNNIDSKMLAILVSSNMKDSIKQQHSTPFSTTDDKTAQILSNYFQVLDPLGGGKYPLNHMIIISNSKMRVKINLKFNNCNPYERFGIPLSQIQMFLEDVIPNL